MHDLKELDRARERWRLMRRRLGQSADAEHRSLGLARRIENLSARLLILPSDHGRARVTATLGGKVAGMGRLTARVRGPATLGETATATETPYVKVAAMA